MTRRAGVIALLLVAGCGDGAGVDAGVPCGELHVGDTPIVISAMAYADYSRISSYDWYDHADITTSRDGALRLTLRSVRNLLGFQNAVSINRDGSLQGRFWGAGGGHGTWGGSTAAGIYVHRTFTGAPGAPEAVESPFLYWWDTDAERMITEVEWEPRWPIEELAIFDSHWVHVAADQTMWLLRDLDAGTSIHVFDRALGEVTPPEGLHEETRLQAPPRHLASIVAPTDDGGLWYLVDRTGPPGDDAYVLRAVRRDRTGEIAAISPPLGDPGATPVDEWNRSERAGVIGRTTADGAYVVHFTEGWRETVVSRFVRIEHDGTIGWSVDAPVGFLAATGGDGARATLDEHDGGVIAVLLTGGGLPGEIRAFGVNADGSLIHGPDGVTILDERGVRDPEPQRVDDLLVTDARDLGFHVVLDRGGALQLHSFHLDGTRRGEVIGIPINTQPLGWPTTEHAWAFSDGDGGLWTATSSFQTGPIIQHIDRDGVPLFWGRGWYCDESFERWSVDYLRGETPPDSPPLGDGGVR